VILSAPAANRILVEHAQPRRSLARVENARPRAGDRFDERARQCRNAAHALQQVQDHPLAGENHPRIVADDSDRLSIVQPNTIKDFRVGGDFVVSRDRAVERSINIKDAGD
jgi:hypothetical protein